MPREQPFSFLFFLSPWTLVCCTASFCLRSFCLLSCPVGRVACGVLQGEGVCRKCSVACPSRLILIQLNSSVGWGVASMMSIHPFLPPPTCLSFPFLALPFLSFPSIAPCPSCVIVARTCKHTHTHIDPFLACVCRCLLCQYKKPKLETD